MHAANDSPLQHNPLTQAWQRLTNWRRQRLGLRGTLLFVLSAPLAPAAIVALARGDLIGFAGSAGGMALIFFAALLNRRGLLERLVAPKRRFTRAKRIPFQQLALVLVGLGVGLAAWAGVGQGPLVSVVFAVLAATGFHLAYDVPKLPLPASFAAVPVEVADPVVMRTLGQAESQLLAIERAAVRVGNAELAQRLRRIAEKGRAVLDLLASQPANLHQARRFLNVHLDGAERVAVRFARAHPVLRGGVLEAGFRNVLVQIESAFERQRSSLLQHELSDLDIQIAVLRKQLQQEGIT